MGTESGFVSEVDFSALGQNTIANNLLQHGWAATQSKEQDCEILPRIYGLERPHLHTPILIPEDVNSVVADEVAAVSCPQSHTVDGVLLLGHLLLLEDLLLCRFVLHSQEALFGPGYPEGQLLCLRQGKLLIAKFCCTFHIFPAFILWSDLF